MVMVTMVATTKSPSNEGDFLLTYLPIYAIIKLQVNGNFSFLKRKECL